MSVVRTETTVDSGALTLLDLIHVAAILDTDLIQMGAHAMVKIVLINITLPDRNKYYNNDTFLDIDECRESSDGCAQVCTNTAGSYTCSCGVGYRLSTDNLGCNGKNNYI